MSRYEELSVGKLVLGEASRSASGKDSIDFTNAPFNVTYTIGTEAADVINVSCQLEDARGFSLTKIVSVFGYLSDAATGIDIVATAPDGGFAIGTDGVLDEITANKTFNAITVATGIVDIDITESGTDTFFLALVLNGTPFVSGAITFAA